MVLKQQVVTTGNYKEVNDIYCNSCQTTILKSDLVYCEQCGVPLHIGCANGCISCGKKLCDVCSIANNFMCEECNIAKNPETTFAVIRRSHLEQYNSCPYSVYLQLVLGKEPPMGSYAQLGIIVHQIIDTISEFNTTHEEAVIVLVDEVMKWNKSIADSIDVDYQYINSELLEVGYTCLENFFLIKGSLTEGYVSEVNFVFSLEEGLPKVSCTLDRVTETADKLIISDWKTGKPMSGKHLVEDLQPPLYIYGVYQKYGKMPDSFSLYYLQHNKIITYNLVDRENWLYEVKTARNTYVLNIKKKLEEVKKILKHMKDGRFPMATEANQWRCRTMCHFGTSGECAGVHNSQWKQITAEYEEKQ